MSKSKTKPYPIFPFLDEIQSVSFSPRFQIIVTNGVFELLVNALIEETCKRGKNIIDESCYTYAIKLTLLHEVGLINDGEFIQLAAFKKLRDQAAHAAFKLNPDSLQPFKDKFTAGYNYPEDFQKLCLGLVVGFWSNHIKEFLNRFELF